MRYSEHRGQQREWRRDAQRKREGCRDAEGYNQAKFGVREICMNDLIRESLISASSDSPIETEVLDAIEHSVRMTTKAYGWLSARRDDWHSLEGALESVHPV